MALIEKTKYQSSTVVELPGSDEVFTKVRQRNSIDLMLRNTQQHNIQLSCMADQKANILIGATLVIQTIIITMSASGNIPIELILMSFFSFCSTWFAVQAVFPALSKIQVKEEDRNLLFFGHYTEMEINDYYDEMSKILKEDKLVYKAVVKDIYHMGLYLKNRKYRYLRLSYILFLTGLFVSFVTFILSQLGLF